MSTESPGSVQTFTCSNCGATTSFDAGSQTLRCPFCGTQMAVRATGAAVPTITAPQYVLPFKLDKDTSISKVREWLGDSFFAPGDLKSRSALDRGQGTYVPFWRFDADCDSDWEGEVSRTQTRQVARTFTNADGKQERRMEDEQYKTWHPRTGQHSGHHRTFVCASQWLTQEEADKLMPFPEEGMRTYSTDLLAGYSSEEPGIDERGAWEPGENRIREMERDECASEVERLTSVETRVSNRQSAVCYLPVWLYNYQYDGKQYRVLVNGHTGEIVGDRPTSKLKVWLVAGAVVLVILVIVLLIWLL
jgi:DNA-directed RNA polymerase subunit RPC12/RpoP